MSEEFLGGKVVLHQGDCLDVLPTLAENSIDAVVTDPPYGLQFMGREWDKLWRNETEADRDYVERTKGALTSRARKLPDYSATKPAQMQEWHLLWAKECLRVLKPGAHLLAFSGSRTYHRMTCAIEDAGFEIRDCIFWCYGAGFPKSHDIAKAIDKAAGHWRGCAGEITIPKQVAKGTEYERTDKGDPITPDAIKWAGWGSALKPAVEPICVARKPLSESSIAANVLKHGTGGINIDGCRIGVGGQLKWESPRDMGYHGGSDAGSVAALENTKGRWPANLILSWPEDEYELRAFVTPEQKRELYRWLSENT